MTILDWLFGIKVATRDEIVRAFNTALDKVDEDADGQISIGDLYHMFKRILKEIKK